MKRGLSLAWGTPLLGGVCLLLLAFATGFGQSNPQRSTMAQTTDISGSDIRAITIAWKSFIGLKNIGLNPERKKLENYRFRVESTGAITSVEFVPKSDAADMDLGAYTAHGVCIVYRIRRSDGRIIHWALGK
jgi:hypothetical protein